ncbi:hypothetical protein [Nocardiopsis synnemataformans]|uniref:hypothetical protein n=1 Tax=Nocardiopsis synnemataformans TaxID=61305 RepID=UPI003EB9FEA1
MSHSPGRPEDLPRPEVLWARAGVLAALTAGLEDNFEILSLEDGVLRYHNGGSSDWYLAWCGTEGRAVIVGYDRDTSDTTHDDKRPVDLFAEAPDWLPWEWIAAHEARTNIGFAYWWDGRAWARGLYPDDWEDDGLSLDRYASVEAAVDEIVERVFEGFAPEDEHGKALLPEPGAALMRRAQEGTVDADSLAAVLNILDTQYMDDDEDEADDADEGSEDAGGGEEEDEARPWDAHAALAAAERLGLTPGSRRPLLPLGTARPERPPHPVISEKAWSLLVWDALHREPERERPPVPETDELLRVLARIRALGLTRGSEAVVEYTFGGDRDVVDGSGARFKGYDTELMDGLRALRAAEDVEGRGRWLYLRLTVSEEGHGARRHYDRWPEGTSFVGMDMTGSLYRLREEAPRRAPEWRPAWAELVGEGVLVRPPAPAPSERPGRPVAALDEEGQRALLGEIAELLPRPRGWRKAVLDARFLAGYERLRVGVALEDGTVYEEHGHYRLPYLVRTLRAGMYRPGRGTWFGLRYTVGRDGSRVEADRDSEPAFDMAPLDFDYALDQAYFPRSREHVPAWLAERLAAARG